MDMSILKNFLQDMIPYALPVFAGLGSYFILKVLSDIFYASIVTFISHIYGALSGKEKNRFLSFSHNLEKINDRHNNGYYFFMALGVLFFLFTIQNIPLAIVFMISLAIIAFSLDDTKIREHIRKTNARADFLNILAQMLKSTGAYYAFENKLLLEVAKNNNDVELIEALSDILTQKQEKTLADAAISAFSKTVWYRHVAEIIQRTQDKGAIATAAELEEMANEEKNRVVPKYNTMMRAYASLNLYQYILVVALALLIFISFAPWSVSYQGDASFIVRTMVPARVHKTAGNPLRDFYIYTPSMANIVAIIVFFYAMLSFLTSRYIYSVMESA